MIYLKVYYYSPSDSQAHSPASLNCIGIMRLVAESPQRDNVITAAISDLFVFIEKETLKGLINYLIEKYAHMFTVPGPDLVVGVPSMHEEVVTLSSVSRWVVLFQNLRIKYDQIHDTSLGSSRYLLIKLLSLSPINLLISSNSMNDRNRENDRDDSYFFDYDDDYENNGNISYILLYALTCLLSHSFTRCSRWQHIREYLSLSRILPYKFFRSNRSNPIIYP